MTSRAEAARAFASLELAVDRRLAGRLHGREEGLRLGPGSEPEEVARYAPGADDVRRIDWNVTARSSEPHVWRTRAQHERETWVLVDDTASMHFGTAASEKRDLAAWVTGAIGLLSDGPGNRLGTAWLRADGLTWSAPLPPRRAAMLALATPPPATQSAPTPAPTPAPATVGLAEALALLERRHRRLGVRVVVSDFVEPDGRTDRPFTWEAPLRRLAHRHAVLVVETVDPRDLELPDMGALSLVDPETGHTAEVLTTRRVREDYAALAAAHRAAVAAAVRAAGAEHVVVRTDRDWLTDLARFLRRRRAPRRTPSRAASGTGSRAGR